MIHRKIHARRVHNTTNEAQKNEERSNEERNEANEEENGCLLFVRISLHIHLTWAPISFNREMMCVHWDFTGIIQSITSFYVISIVLQPGSFWHLLIFLKKKIDYANIIATCTLLN